MSSESFPPIKIHICDPARREPGYMIVPVGKEMRIVRRDSEFEALLALDVEGKIAWEWRSPGPLIGDVKRTARNTLLTLSSEGVIYEVDFKGDIVASWSTAGRNPRFAEGSIPLATRLFHHAIQGLPNGNLAALSITHRDVDDVPLSADDIYGPRGRRRYMADTLVEFQRDGTIIREFDFFDILDVNRIAYSHDMPFWQLMELEEESADWTHANGFEHDASDDSFIVCLRHQDCVIKIDRVSGTLKWIMGTPSCWTGPWAEKLLRARGKTSYFWHAHDPSLRADGTLLLFDNGEAGAFPPDPKTDLDTLVSRGVAYRFDERARTFEEVWSFGGPDQGTPFSMYIGGAQELPQTGNVFLTFGGIILMRPDNRRTDAALEGHGSAELYEVTGGDNPQVVFHAEINNRDTEEEKAWAVFRCEHVSSLQSAS